MYEGGNHPLNGDENFLKKTRGINSVFQNEIEHDINRNLVPAKILDGLKKKYSGNDLVMALLPTLGQIANKKAQSIKKWIFCHFKD